MPYSYLLYHFMLIYVTLIIFYVQKETHNCVSLYYFIIIVYISTIPPIELFFATSLSPKSVTAFAPPAITILSPCFKKPSFFSVSTPKYTNLSIVS